MKPVTVLEFQKHMSGKKIFPVYFLSGEESFLIDDCLDKIEKKINTDCLNREIFQSSDCSGEDIFNAVQTLPFLTDKRVVVIKAANKLKNSDFEIVSALIKNPVETACLILIFPEKLKNSSSKRKDLASLCFDSENCFCVECKKLYESGLKKFIYDEFKNRGKTAASEVIEQMIDESGIDLLSLSNEIEKICLYTGQDKKNIAGEDFVKVSGFTKEVNTFMLTNAIEEKNLKYSLFILEKMIQTGEKPVMILSALATALRKLLTAKSLTEEKKYTPQQTAEYVKIPNFFDFRSKYMRNLSKYTLKHLKDCMDELLKTDVSIKTGKTDEISALENLVLFICK